MVTTGTGTLEDVVAVASAVTDPEIPVVTIADLGILRGVAIEDDVVVVTITPTYSGCPAMDVIRQDIEEAVASAGYGPVEVRTVLAPAWTTDWITDDGKRKLAEFGIAPPHPATLGRGPVLCPRCQSDDTRTVSEFGSTACKALLVCDGCGEPFDYFKEH